MSESEVWVLEDDPSILFVYEEMLAGVHSVRLFSRMSALREALDQVPAEHPPKALVADIRLPDESFRHFLSQGGRARLGSVPFLVVTSEDDMDSLTFFFKEGAKDYLTK